MRLLFALLLLFLIQSAQAQVDKVRFEVPKEISVGQTFELGIHFSLTSLAGMARLQLDFPKGFEVQESKNSGALFIYSANLLQLLWVQLPQADSMHCAVKVECLPGFGGKAEIAARLYYLENGARNEIAFNACKLSISGEASKRFMPMKREESKSASAVAPKPAVQKAGGTVKQQDKSVNQPNKSINSEKTDVPQKGVEVAPKPDKANHSKADKAEVGKPSEDGIAKNQQSVNAGKAETPENREKTAFAAITFRIQLAASSEKSSPEALATRFNLKATEISEEFHNGMYKYTSGNFKTLAAAREAMGKNAAMKTGCFIAGYENGTRIALEDAIRLSKK